MNKLIITIVPRDNGEFITDAANKAGARGGTIILGKGTAENSILQLFGLGDSSKDITFSIVDNEIYKSVIESICTAASEKKAHFGVLFSIDLVDFIKSGNMNNHPSLKTENDKEDKPMNDSTSYEMLNIIVNKGYAEDAMAAARKVGAGGGTIISARGTAREDDAKFFGMKIVPEKDMLIILIPSDKKEQVVDAIKALPCLTEAGSGIVFSSKANDFTLLGKK